MSDVCLENTKTAGIYTLYSVGLCIPVGLVRLVVSVSFLVYHCFFSCSQDLQYNQRSRARQREAEGTSDWGDKAWNLFKGVADKGVTEGVKLLDAADTPDWGSEAIRGLAEFCLIGGIIYTGIDHLGPRNVSWLGIDELAQKIDQEFNR